MPGAAATSRHVPMVETSRAVRKFPAGVGGSGGRGPQVSDRGRGQAPMGWDDYEDDEEKDEEDEEDEEDEDEDKDDEEDDEEEEDEEKEEEEEEEKEDEE